MTYLKIQVLNQEEAKKQAVFEIKTQQDLTSSNFGPLSNQDICPQCGKLSKLCQRHMGYIQLPFPVFSSILSPQAINIISNICLNCCKYPIKAESKQEFLKFQKILKANQLPFCMHCKAALKCFEFIFFNFSKKSKLQIPLQVQCTQAQAYHIQELLTGDKTGVPSENLVQISPYVIQEILKFVQSQIEISYLEFNPQVISGFLSDIILVPPTQLRTSNVGGILQNNNTNQVYNTIIREVQHFQSESLFVNDLFFNKSIIGDIFEKNNNFTRLSIACRIILGKDSSKNTNANIKADLLKVIKQKQQDPASPFAQAINKMGIFRQSITAVRTKNSGRTVAGGAPYNDTDVVEIPQLFANKLSAYTPINNTNITQGKQLILNFPIYPFAQKVYQYIDEDTYIQIKINEDNKEMQSLKIKPGDIILRTLVDNDICMFNRYPTIREESFSSHRIKITNKKTINFPITVIEKMAADFDGDEMEIWCLSCPSDIIEACMLYSCHRQFISPDYARNVIGGKPDGDMGAGIWNMNKYKFNELGFIDPKNGKTGQEIIQKIFTDVFEDTQFLNYDDGKITIKNGQVIAFNEKVCSSGSEFLNFLAFYYPTTKVIQMMDKVIIKAYNTNLQCSSSVPVVMYMNNKNRNDLTFSFQQKTIKSQQQFLDEYFTGNLIPNENISKEAYLNKLLNIHVGDNDLDQILQLKEVILNNSKQDCFSYKYILSDKALSGVLKLGCCQLGQQYQFGYRIQPDKRYHRRFVTQIKMLEEFDYGGYIKNGFIYGLTQQEMTMHQLSARYEMFQRGNATPDTGYLSRRINQGMCNIHVKHNGIVYGEGDAIISFQYGSQGLDPRMNYTVPFLYHKQTDEEIEKKYKSHPMFDEIKNIIFEIRKTDMIMKEINPQYQSFDYINIPFLPVVKEITLEQLQELFNSRVTQKMTDEQMLFQISQAFPFYIYCLFELKIVKKNPFDIIKYYQSCLVNAGEPVGSKSALGASSIFTQLALSAIHTKGASSKINPLISTTKAYERFQELISSKKFPTIVQFQLFDCLRLDQQYQKYFIQKNQTLSFQQLKPQFNIYLTQDKFLGQKKIIEEYNDVDKSTVSNYVIEIKFNIDYLAYMNFDDEIFTNNIFALSPNIFQVYAYPSKNEEELIYLIHLNEDVDQNKLQFIKAQIYKMQIGSKIMENMYYEETEDGYVIRCNVNSSINYKNLFNISYIDHQTIQCNNHHFDYEMFGVVSSRNTLYNELLNNFSSEDKTRGLQYAHAKLISDTLTFKGQPTEFTRNSYKKNNIVNALELLLFESAPQVLNNTLLLKNQKQQLKTILNMILFGSKGESGTHISNILFNDIVKEKKIELESSTSD